VLRGIASNGMGPVQVTWEALRAWRVEMRVPLEPWESLALVRLGYARAVIESQQIAASRKAKTRI